VGNNVQYFGYKNVNRRLNITDLNGTYVSGCRCNIPYCRNQLIVVLSICAFTLLNQGSLNRISPVPFCRIVKEQNGLTLSAIDKDFVA